MTGPVLAAQRFAVACLYGAALGCCYDFLRPLRPKHTTLSDLLFCLLVFWAWLQVSFRVCQGDLRLGYTMGLAVGGLAWEFTAGRWVNPVFFWFWKKIAAIWRFICRPVKKYVKKNYGFFQKNYWHPGENGLQ